jgi:prepilin-type N-terminal cleavage/methylation domain-containing protein
LKYAQFFAKSRKMKISTTGIHGVFRGLKFESDAELVQKGEYFKGLRGFTLVELLVAMVLLSMVTLVVAMALRMSIKAWERGVEEGEHIQRRVAIPSLMKK